MLKSCYLPFDVVCYAVWDEFSQWPNGKEFSCSAGDTGDGGFEPWVRKIFWSRAYNALPEKILPEKFHCQPEQPDGLRSKGV